MMITNGTKDISIIQVDPQPKSAVGKFEKVHKTDEKHQSKQERDQPLLHSGPILGDLPNLTPSKSSPTKHLNQDVDAALNLDSKPSSSGLLSTPTGNPSRKADDKKAKKKKKVTTNDVPPDIPKEYLCQLTKKPMSEPMKTIYGNIYDKTAIMNWFSSQGRICPLTGMPFERRYIIWYQVLIVDFHVE